MVPKRILVTRFSAMGDVAMTVPVLRAVSEQHPDVELVFASQKFARAFIQDIPRITFFEVDLKGRHRGLWGIFKLAKELGALGQWYAYADLHDVLRTKILRALLSFSIKRIAKIDKGRREKRQLTQRNSKVVKQLDHTIARYGKVFNKTGIEVSIEEKKLKVDAVKGKDKSLLPGAVTGNIWVGVAPFAKHKGKMYPVDRMEMVVKELSTRENISIILFGGGENEARVLLQWQGRFSNTLSLAGKLSLSDELKIMSQLDLIVTMDSANLHMASNLGVPAISIWGATHPFAGFYGWGQPQHNAIQNNTLICRPCSVFGNKPCYRKDYACLTSIEPHAIIGLIDEHLYRLLE